MFVGIESMTPGEYARGGGGLTIRYGFTDSLLGRLLIASMDRGICHMAFTTDEGVADEGAADKAAMDEVGRERLRRAFPGGDMPPC